MSGIVEHEDSLYHALHTQNRKFLRVGTKNMLLEENPTPRINHMGCVCTGEHRKGSLSTTVTSNSTQPALTRVTPMLKALRNGRAAICFSEVVNQWAASESDDVGSVDLYLLT